MIRRTTSRAAVFALGLGAAGACVASACASDHGHGNGPTARIVSDAAERHGVPVDLMLAIADVEGGLRLRAVRDIDPDDIPVAGVLELRHAAYDSLSRGAELMGAPELDLVADLATGTEAGALVLADLAHEGAAHRDDIASWAPIVEKISGYREPWRRAEYRARVFAKLRGGGQLKARDGEIIELEPRDDVPAGLTISPPPIGIEGGTPDYAGATWFSTSCDNKCNTSRNATISMIAIHDTEVGWDASVSTLQFDGGKSVHYIVDADGSRVGQFIPESYNGWHVGNSYYNNRMVGIEHVGHADVDDYQASMYAASALLVKDIAARNDIPLDRAHIIAHQEVPDGSHPDESAPACSDSPSDCIDSGHFGGSAHHNDPGVYWEWCQYMEMVGSSCKCNDTYELWNCVHDLSMMNRCVNGQVEIQHCASPCVVEPIGTDDHCVPDTPTSSTASGAGGAAAATSTGAGAGTTGAGGDGGGGLGDDNGVDGSCGCRVASEEPSGGVFAIVLGLGALARRRRSRRPGALR